MQKRDLVVALCSSHAEALQTVIKIQQSGFDLKNVSIIHRDKAGRHHTGSGSGSQGRQKVPRAIAFEPALLKIPDFGAIAVAGPLLPAIAEQLESAAPEARFSALGAGLQKIGIPEINVPGYETAIRADNTLIIAHCPAYEAVCAKELLAVLSVGELAVHHV